MRVFVTGGEGLLAAAIVREFGSRPAALGEIVRADEGSHHVVAPGRAALDITNAEAVHRSVAEMRPDVVINCAAYNDVDAAEDAAQTALRINAFAVRALASAARTAGALFVHFGTDFVFDGQASRPYREEDPPNPRGVYATSKLLGDWFALEHPEAYVLRVESLFGEPGPGTKRRGSLATLVQRMRNGEAAPVFTDRTVSPSYTADVARATRMLLERRAAPGLYHCVNTGATTWAAIATEAARLLDLPLSVTPITLDTVALKARRPLYSALSNAKLAEAGIAMPKWEEALAVHLKGIAAS